jgi:hypothetical protein
MRRAAILAIALAAAGAAVSTPALGYEPVYPQDGRYDPHTPEGPRYEYARVLRVDPVLGGGGYPASQQRCHTREDHYSEGYGRDGYRDYGPYGNDPYARDGYGDSRGDDANARMVATVVGGVVGAVLGSKVGGGSGRYATSAIGTMVGGMAGREIYEATRRDRIDRRGRVTVCDPVPDRYGADPSGRGVQAYDVTYEYGGRRYTTRTDYHPGDTIRVRVDVRPE